MMEEPLYKVGDFVMYRKNAGFGNKYEIIGYYLGMKEDHFYWLRWAGGYGFETTGQHHIKPYEDEA